MRYADELGLADRLPTEQSLIDARRMAHCIKALYVIADRIPRCGTKVVLNSAITDLSYVASVLRGDFDGRYR